MFNPFKNTVNHIAIIAPAGPPKHEDIDTACHLLQTLGVEVTVMPNLFKGDVTTYLSATIEERLADLHACWKNSSIDTILCARGGFGSAQLLPYIDWNLLKTRPIPLLGYSDITALHMGMLKMNVGIPIVSPMVSTLPEALKDDFTAHSLAETLAGTRELLPLMEVSKKIKVVKSGRATARVIVANLTVLASLAGSRFFPDCKGNIVVIEDVGESPYRLDRLLTQLELNSLFDECAGVVFGEFKNCGNAKVKDTIFARVAERINGPVISSFPFGHSLPFLSMRCGERATIEA